MFSTLKQKLLLGLYIFILLSIPVGAYLASEYQTIKSGAQEKKTTKPLVKVTPRPTLSPAKQLLNSSELAATQGVSAVPTPSPSPSVTTSFGPTLSFKVSLEGRPKANQAVRLFVAISEGALTVNPKFLLSFTVDLPATGEYSNLSLAGLNPGSQYTALLKGSAQIATSSAFVMSPAVSNLNGGQPLNLLSGDLNDDNVINTADYSIAKNLMGITSSSSSWNDNVDLNKDGIINSFDLGIIVKNMGQAGASGAWTSPLPKLATPSASLTSPPVGSPENGGPVIIEPSGGYWIWIPK